MAGLPEPAAIIRNYAVAGIQQRKALIFPHVAGQRPTMDEYDRTAFANILHMNLHTVFGFDERH